MISVIDGWDEIALKWLSPNLNDDKSSLVQGLVPTGKKPLSEPELTKIYVGI